MGCSSGFASKTKDDDDSLNVIEKEIEEMKAKLAGLKDKHQGNVEEALLDPIKEDIDTLEADLEAKVKQAEMKIQEMKDDDSAKKEREDKKEGFLKVTMRELRKVSWPSFGEVIKYSLAVIIFCLIFVGFFELVQLLATYIKWVFR